MNKAGLHAVKHSVAAYRRVLRGSTNYVFVLACDPSTYVQRTTGVIFRGIRKTETQMDVNG